MGSRTPVRFLPSKGLELVLVGCSNPQTLFFAKFNITRFFLEVGRFNGHLKLLGRRNSRRLLVRQLSLIIMSYNFAPANMVLL